MWERRCRPPGVGGMCAAARCVCVCVRCVFAAAVGLAWLAPCVLLCNSTVNRNICGPECLYNIHTGPARNTAINNRHTNSPFSRSLSPLAFYFFYFTFFLFVSSFRALRCCFWPWALLIEHFMCVMMMVHVVVVVASAVRTVCVSRRYRQCLCVLASCVIRGRHRWPCVRLARCTHNKHTYINQELLGIFGIPKTSTNVQRFLRSF